MHNLRNKRLFIVLVCIFSSLLLTQCAQVSVRSPKPSPDWSRGSLVGEHAVGSPSMLASAGGESIEMIWPVHANEDRQTLHYARLNQLGVLIDEYDLDISTLQVRVPHMLPAEEGKLHVFWESRSVPGGKWSLWYGLLDMAEKSLSAPAMISAPDVDLKSYHLAGDASGGAFVVWETKDGIVGSRVDAAGTLPSDPIQITTAGRSPFICVENASILMTWQTASGIRFQSFDTQFEPSEGIIIATPRLGGSESLYGPVMGMTDTQVYVAWSIRRQTGLEAGSALTEFVSFQKDAPEKVDSSPVLILPVTLDPYKTYQGPYTLGQLVPPPVSAPSSSDYIYNPIPVVNAQDDFAFAVAVKQSDQNKLATQIVLALFQDGKYSGYSQAVKTQTLSSSPAPTADDAGNLHLAWREGHAGSDIYYTTTAPLAREQLDQLQGADFVQALLSGLVEGLASLSLVPLLGVIWIFPGFAVLAIFKLFRDMETLDSWNSWLFLVIGLICYQILKWFTFLPLHSYVPFSAWIDVPAAWNVLLRWGLPALIFGIALIVAERRRRSRSCSALVYYLTATVVDVTLTMIIYGVNVIGLG